MAHSNYNIDNVYKELEKLCSKGKNAFDEFFVEKDEVGFLISICDDNSYIKLDDFVPISPNINKMNSSFHIYYEKQIGYMTIYAHYDDENAINCLIDIVKLLSDLGSIYTKCRNVSDEIQICVSAL